MRRLVLGCLGHFDDEKAENLSEVLYFGIAHSDELGSSKGCTAALELWTEWIFPLSQRALRRRNKFEFFSNKTNHLWPLREMEFISGNLNPFEATKVGWTLENFIKRNHRNLWVERCSVTSSFSYSWQPWRWAWQSLVIAQDENHYFLAGMLFPVFATRPKSELFMENFYDGERLHSLAGRRRRRIWIWLLAVLRCPIFKTLNFNLYSASRTVDSNRASHSLPVQMAYEKKSEWRTLQFALSISAFLVAFLVSSSKWKRFLPPRSGGRKFPCYFVRCFSASHNISPWKIVVHKKASNDAKTISKAVAAAECKFQLVVHPNKLLTYWCCSEKLFPLIRHLLDRRQQPERF